MATLIFSTLGRAIGGRGGAAIGALIGHQADRLLFAPSAQEGPRLRDLAVTTSSYGEAVPQHFGRMRVGGTIIWAADLRETRQTSGGGKGRPAQTTYSYAASFAVALSSRPLAGIGRIWADGTLLRGAAGDLKVGGALRFHAGHGDQAPDPLLAAAEGLATCPAFRGLAYAVFEDLALADFGNRLPTLSFEVFGGEEALDLAAVCGIGAAAGRPSVDLGGAAGASLEGPAAGLLDALAPLVPFACDVAGDDVTLLGPPGAARLLPEAAASPEAAVHRREAPSAPALGGVRYYDVARDYQPGVQFAPAPPGGGLAAAGQPRMIELPLAFDPAAARDLVAGAAQRAGWGREVLTWRTPAIDPLLGPGALAALPDRPGQWRVTDWEWRADGLELTLSRVPAPGAGGATTAADPGRAATAPDRVGGATVLEAFELPWDGTGTSGALHVAASSAAAGWSGAALYLDDGAGGLEPAGSSGRQRCVLGTAVDVLADGTSLLPDRGGAVTVQLLAPDLDLADASGPRLAQGANRALLGEEIIQFASAVPLGGGRWRLAGLLRGRGGTEAATAGHRAGERFVLLDDRLVVLGTDAASPVNAAAVGVAAIGLVDAAPVRTGIALRGIGGRPLSPVHPAARKAADGSLELGWTRRARGAWAWTDGADVPLHEEAELYEVLVGALDAPAAAWTVSEPRLTLSPDTLRSLRTAAPGAPVQVRQRGSYAVSPALLLTRLD